MTSVCLLCNNVKFWFFIFQSQFSSDCQEQNRDSSLNTALFQSVSPLFLCQRKAIIESVRIHTKCITSTIDGTLDREFSTASGEDFRTPKKLSSSFFSIVGCSKYSTATMTKFQFFSPPISPHLKHFWRTSTKFFQNIRKWITRYWRLRYTHGILTKIKWILNCKE